jgi:hypothetical protein
VGRLGGPEEGRAMNAREFWVKHGRVGSAGYRRHYKHPKRKLRRSVVNAYRRAYEAFRRSDSLPSPAPPTSLSGARAAELRRKVVRKLRREGVL